MKNLIIKKFVPALLFVIALMLLTNVSKAFAAGYGPYGPYGPHNPEETSLVTDSILSIVGIALYGVGSLIIAYASKIRSLLKI